MRFEKRTVTCTAMFSVMVMLLLAVPAWASHAKKGPVKVFILAGQSNMEGQGVVTMDDPRYYNGGKGNLVWSMKNSKSAEKRNLRA